MDNTLKILYFALAFAFFMVASVIYLLGNPAIFSGVFCWHYIPEVISLFFYGCFFASFKFFKLKFAFILSGVAVAVSAVAISIITFTSATNLVLLAYLAVLILPLDAGCFLEKRKMRLKSIVEPCK